MADDVREAISKLIAERSKNGQTVLHVAREAERLAEEHGGNSREIADLIIAKGVEARISMELDHPREGQVEPGEELS